MIIFGHRLLTFRLTDYWQGQGLFHSSYAGKGSLFDLRGAKLVAHHLVTNNEKKTIELNIQYNKWMKKTKRHD